MWRADVVAAAGVWLEYSGSVSSCRGAFRQPVSMVLQTAERQAVVQRRSLSCCHNAVRHLLLVSSRIFILHKVVMWNTVTLNVTANESRHRVSKCRVGSLGYKRVQ